MILLLYEQWNNWLHLMICNDKQEIVLNKNCHYWSVRHKEVKFLWIFSLGPRFRVRCPYYRGYFYKECMGIFSGPNELSVLERCP